LFRPVAEWEQAASHLQVFKLYGEWVAYRATDEVLRLAVADIRRRGLELAVEAGPLNPLPKCGQGGEGFAGTDEGRNIARRIEEAGGRLDLIALDEPFFFARIYDGPNACGWDGERIARGVGDFISIMRSVFPEVIVGDTEPLAGGGDAAAYRGWLRTFRRVNGYDLAFLRMDIDWARPTWPDEVKAIENFGREFGVPVGIIYNGNYQDPTDEAWLSIAGERVKRYELEAGGRPDHVLFQSWQDKPDRTLPESTPYTFTGFIRMYFRGPVRPRLPRGGRRGQPGLRQAGPGVTGVPGDGGRVRRGRGSGDGVELRRRPPCSGSRSTWARLRHRRGAIDGESVTAEPLRGIGYIWIDPTRSPSWVSWREIEVMAAP
jgi:hypothetical protein